MKYSLLSLVTLKSGIKFRALLPDNTVSAEYMLTKDIRAEIIKTKHNYTVYDTFNNLTIIVGDYNELLRASTPGVGLTLNPR